METSWHLQKQKYVHRSQHADEWEVKRESLGCLMSCCTSLIVKTFFHKKTFKFLDLENKPITVRFILISLLVIQTTTFLAWSVFHLAPNTNQSLVVPLQKIP